MKTANLNINSLIEGPTTLWRTAQAWNLFVLNGKLVVVCDLFRYCNRLLRIDDHFLFPFNRNDFGVTVGLYKI